MKKCLNKETNIEYAAKYIRKRRGGGRRGAKMEDIKKEVDILHQIDHPNIIQLYEVYETKLEVILVLELYVSSFKTVILLRSPDPKSHVRYCHHLAIVCKLLHFNLPL